MYGPPRSLEFEGGRSACGKLSLLLSRCARCAREEQAALTAEADPAEGDVPPSAIGSVSARRAALGPKWLPGPARLISSLDVLALSASGRVGSGESLEVRSVVIGSAPVPLYGDVRGKPYRITFCVADGAVALVQACVETSLEWAIEASLHPHLPVGSRVVQVFAAD